jgi:Protein of unknown function (DUF1579)
MKSLIFLIGLCVVASIFNTNALAQGPVQATAEHKILASEEGTWDATVKSFEGGPNSEPAVSKGTEVNTLLPGGLWLISKFEGEFGGVKFEGHGQFGFDPYKKKYIGTWVDSMMPTMSVLEGEYDAKTKTMTYAGEGTGPDGKSKYMQRMVTTTKDDGSRVFTLYMKMDKDEMKVLEITYTKRK